MTTINFANLPHGKYSMPYDDGQIILWIFDHNGLAASCLVDSRGLHLGKQSVMQFLMPTNAVQLTVFNGHDAEFTAWTSGDGGFHIADVKSLVSAPQPQDVIFSGADVVRVSTKAGNELYLTTLQTG